MPDPVSPGDERVTLYRVKAIREQTAFGRAYPGVWEAELEGWTDRPPVPGEELLPASRLEAVEAERDALREARDALIHFGQNWHARAERAEEALRELCEAANEYLAGQNFGGYKDGNYGHDEGCREARAALCGVLYPLNEAAEALHPSQPKEKG